MANNDKWFWVKEFLAKYLKKFFYLKLCHERANSYVAPVKSSATDLVLITMWLKLYGVGNTFIVVCIFLLVYILLVWFGHVDVTNKWAHIETSVKNQINPELMAVYNNTKKGD